VSRAPFVHFGKLSPDRRSRAGESFSAENGAARGLKPFAGEVRVDSQVLLEADLDLRSRREGTSTPVRGTRKNARTHKVAASRLTPKSKQTSFQEVYGRISFQGREIEAEAAARGKSYTVDSPLDFAPRLAIDSPQRGDFQ
jgi:hypothetical protein